MVNFHNDFMNFRFINLDILYWLCLLMYNNIYILWENVHLESIQESKQHHSIVQRFVLQSVSMVTNWFVFLCQGLKEHGSLKNKEALLTHVQMYVMEMCTNSAFGSFLYRKTCLMVGCVLHCYHYGQSNGTWDARH